jgi:hypothetical protein
LHGSLRLDVACDEREHTGQRDRCRGFLPVPVFSLPTVRVVLNPKVHLKVLGVAYIVTGAFICAFLLIVVVMGTLAYFGKGSDTTSPSEAAIVFFSLVYPAMWIIQTGWALYTARKSARLYGLILGALLFLGLNLVLLLLRDESQGGGFVVFHVLMIAIGLYSIAVLAPKSIVRYLE